MDEISQKTLDNIVVREPHELNKANIDFLRARRSYLSPEQLDKFEDVLAPKKKPTKKKKTK